MNNISRRFLNGQSEKIVLEYAAISALIAAFCVSAVKFGVVDALIAVLCLSVLTEVSTGLKAKFNPVFNAHAGLRR